MPTGSGSWSRRRRSSTRPWCGPRPAAAARAGWRGSTSRTWRGGWGSRSARMCRRRRGPAEAEAVPRSRAALTMDVPTRYARLSDARASATRGGTMHGTILAAAGLLAAGGVAAQVRADPIYTVGTFTTSGQVDRYTVNLKRGGWYALSVPALAPGDSLLATITDPRGHVVGRKAVGSTQDEGFGFRADVTGPYTLSLRETGGELIWNYGWYVGGDCPDKRATPFTPRLCHTPRHV